MFASSADIIETRRCLLTRACLCLQCNGQIIFRVFLRLDHLQVDLLIYVALLAQVLLSNVDFYNVFNKPGARFTYTLMCDCYLNIFL